MTANYGAHFDYLLLIVIVAIFVVSFIENRLYTRFTPWYFSSGIPIFTRTGSYQKGMDLYELAVKLVEFDPGNKIRLGARVKSDNRILLVERIRTPMISFNRRYSGQFILMMSTITLDTYQGKVEFVGRLRWSVLTICLIIIMMANTFMHYDGFNLPFWVIMAAFIVGGIVYFYIHQVKVYDNICSFLDRELGVISKKPIE